MLAKVFDKTGANYEQSALEQIAKAGKGSVRDTLSVAEMCKAFANNNITYNAVMQCLGFTEDKTLFELADAILDKNGQKILDILELLYNEGKNINVLISDLCDYFQTLLSVKFGCDVLKTVPQDIANNFTQLSIKADKKYLLDCVKKLCDAENLIKFCSSEKAFAQTTLLSMFYDDNMEVANLKKKVAELENVLNGEFAQKKTLISNSNPKKIEQSQATNINKSDLKQEQVQDNPFDKAEANNTNHAASEIFGKLIKHVRESAEMRLFAGMSEIAEVGIVGSEFVIECKCKDCCDLINEHKQFILNFLLAFGVNNIKVVLQVDKEKQRQEKLKELFGEKLKII